MSDPIILGNGYYPKYRYRVTEVAGWIEGEVNVGDIFVSNDKGEEHTWEIKNVKDEEATITGQRLGIFTGKLK